MSIRYGKYEIYGTGHCRGQKTTVSAFIINEEDVPELKDNEEPLKWLLLTLTSIPLKNIEEVIRVVNIYRTRWIIERFHYTLKSGCTVEKLQLEERQRLDVAVAIYNVVAWFLL